MRNIKFRAWDEKAKRMTAPAYELIETETNVTQMFHYPEYDGYWFNKIMQYTGLKDKNGKEIYEGDILTTYNKSYTYKVLFEKGRFVAYHTKEYLGIWGDLYKAFEPSFVELGIVVIGNIYENPELIK